MIEIFSTLLWLLTISIIVKVVLSLIISFSGARPHPALMSINDLLTRLTEPILGPLRRVLPTFGMLDFSPLVALVILGFIRGVLERSA